MVDSPCISNCELENGICNGCGRTRQEIVLWSSMSDKEKKGVLERLTEKD